MDRFGKNPASNFALSFFFILHSAVLFCHGAFSITQGEFLRETQTLISENQHFELGFFSPSNSSLRYVGIWYHNIQQQSVIWVANRENPISDLAGALTVGDDRNLIVLDGNNNTVWSTNASISPSGSSSVKLSDEGNLILSTGVNASIDSWTSFEHPTDSFLPGMRVLVNAAMGENRVFTSWKSENNPSVGNYTLGVDPRGSPQIVIWEKRNRIWRSGHWDSQKFNGVPNMSASLLYGFGLSRPDDEGNRYFTYTPLNSSDYLRFKINWNGQEEQLRWEENLDQWTVMQSQPASECELYNRCGNFGVCTGFTSPKCSCMDGFIPKNNDRWNDGNWSDGCVRRTPLLCQGNSSNSTEEDGFSAINGLKLPDFVDLVVVGYMETCKAKCLTNCTCTAYADVAGIGCMIWEGELIDMQRFADGGSSLNIRLAHSEFAENERTRLSTSIIIVISIVGAILLAVIIGLLWRFREKLKVLHTSSSNGCWKSSELPIYDVSKSREFSKDFSGPSDFGIERDDTNGPELPFYSFNSVAAATDNFSDKTKLGQGGFGPVYKGMLPGGKEIAVKRLSVRSGQGIEEFKNEITLIAKLQHRNLVRLLGYCVQGEEKMLLYEYMPNKSLDNFIFGDSSKQAMLDWPTRFKIIEGIARGLLYLHRDSRLRIIHRDLKTSNILLDEEMNPKISDFGMARIFGANEDEANTNRVVGTYGYMAPEYAMEGLFSVKSDVYSFGVLLLEIVCGRRNNSFRSSDQSSLIGHAWHLWNERKSMDLLDPSIREASSSSGDEILRCIHVGMLCVQDSPVFRPTMASVVLMLESESTSLPQPRQPTFTSIRDSVDIEQLMDGIEIISSNDMTSTIVVGR